MDDVHKTRGLRLKYLRKEILGDISQTDFLAKLDNYSQGSYSAIERGERKIPLELLEKIREVYGVSIDWLLYGEGFPLKNNPEKINLSNLDVIDMSNQNFFANRDISKKGLLEVDLERTTISPFGNIKETFAEYEAKLKAQDEELKKIDAQIAIAHEDIADARTEMLEDSKEIVSNLAESALSTIEIAKRLAGLENQNQKLIDIILNLSAKKI